MVISKMQLDELLRFSGVKENASHCAIVPL